MCSAGMEVVMSDDSANLWSSFVPVIQLFSPEGLALQSSDPPPSEHPSLSFENLIASSGDLLQASRREVATEKIPDIEALALSA